MTLFYVRQNKISAELRHKYYALGTNSSKKKLHILIGKEGDSNLIYLKRGIYAVLRKEKD